MTHQRNRKIIAAIAFAAASSLIAVQAATAASCASNMKGTWHFHGLEVGPKGSTNAITCVLDIAANGMFSDAPCTSYQPGTSGTDEVSINGEFMLSACDLTGNIVIGGGDPDVTIKSGHVNGNLGSGIATQGTGAKTRVMHFTVVKK